MRVAAPESRGRLVGRTARTRACVRAPPIRRPPARSARKTRSPSASRASVRWSVCAWPAGVQLTRMAVAQQISFPARLLGPRGVRVPNRRGQSASRRRGEQGSGDGVAMSTRRWGEGVEAVRFSVCMFCSIASSCRVVSPRSSDSSTEVGLTAALPALWAVAIREPGGERPVACRPRAVPPKPAEAGARASYGAGRGRIGRRRACSEGCSTADFRMCRAPHHA